MPGQNTLNISLTPRLEDFVHSRVTSGRYGSASEVVREALRLLEDREYSRESAIRGAKQKISEGLLAARQGRMTDGDQFFKDLEREGKPAARKRRKSG